MRRSTRMVGRVPAVLLVVILKHGKVGDPKEFEIVRHVTSALECLVLVGVFARQFQTGFAAGSVLSLLVGGRTRLAFGGNADDWNHKVIRTGFAEVADFCRNLRALLF